MKRTAKDMAKSDPVFGRLNSLIGLLGDEDDRGLVLSMAAFAEDILGRLIRAFLLDVKAAEEIVSGFNAPLGTLSARIKHVTRLAFSPMSNFPILNTYAKSETNSLIIGTDARSPIR